MACSGECTTCKCDDSKIYNNEDKMDRLILTVVALADRLNYPVNSNEELMTVTIKFPHVGKVVLPVNYFQLGVIEGFVNTDDLNTTLQTPNQAYGKLERFVDEELKVVDDSKKSFPV